MNFLPVISSFILYIQISLADSGSLSIYKHKDSVFSSGSESRELLQKIREGDFFQHFIKIKKDGIDFQIDSKKALSEIDLSYQVIDPSSGNLNYIIRCTDLICDLRTSTGEQRSELKRRLISWPSDLGKLVLWRPSLFIHARTNLVTQYAPGSTFLILNLQHEYARVMDLNKPDQEGYLKISDGISKLDMAQYVLFQNRWYQVKYKTRDGLFLAHYPRNPIIFSKVQAILTQPDVYLAKEEIQGTPILARSQLLFQAEMFEKWSYGKHPEHGLIWWKDTPEKKEKLSLEEIQKRKIFSLAHPINKEFPILLSAEGGIFYSENGLEFTHLEQFGNQNWPVAIDPHGYLYVGYQRAHPNFLNFQPFLRPSELAKIFPNSNGNLKILEYAFDRDSIRILTAWGSKRYWIQGAYLNPLSSPWTLF